MWLALLISIILWAERLLSVTCNWIREDGRAFTYTKVAFLVWVTIAIMDLLIHIISLPWLLSPKRECMGQKIGESLWVGLCRLVQECRMHGALGPFPITPARTAGICFCRMCARHLFPLVYTALFCFVLFSLCQKDLICCQWHDHQLKSTNSRCRGLGRMYIIWSFCQVLCTAEHGYSSAEEKNQTQVSFWPAYCSPMQEQILTFDRWYL